MGNSTLKPIHQNAKIWKWAIFEHQEPMHSQMPYGSAAAFCRWSTAVYYIEFQICKQAKCAIRLLSSNDCSKWLVLLNSESKHQTLSQASKLSLVNIVIHTWKCISSLSQWHLQLQPTNIPKLNICCTVSINSCLYSQLSPLIMHNSQLQQMNMAQLDVEYNHLKPLRPANAILSTLLNSIATHCSRPCTTLQNDPLYANVIGAPASIYMLPHVWSHLCCNSL